MRIFFLILSALCSHAAFAFIPYSPNYNLAEEVETHSYRVLPRGEHFTFAIDADFFKPVFWGGDNANYYKYDFYHGNGYWLDLRAEFRANPDLVLNLENDFTHGTSSNGPTYLALYVPRIGLTYRWHRFLGFEWEGRLSDIGRQTIGTGLFVEQKETDGGYLVARQGQFTGKVMVDGTGSFRLDGGLVAFDLNLWDGKLGLTSLIQETETAFTAPQTTLTLYSRHDWKNGLGYGIEAGGNSASTAGLAYLQFKGDLDQFSFWLKPQFRTYGAGILGTLPGRVQHNYISYDQNDKPFTTPMNIFSFGDHVETYSAELKAEYRFNIFYHAFVESEYVNYQFHDREAYRALFGRAGLKFYPFKDRADEFGFLVGNKYLIASTSQIDQSQVQRTYSRPDSPDFENKPLFLQQLYVMINFSTHL